MNTSNRNWATGVSIPERRIWTRREKVNKNEKQKRVTYLMTHNLRCQQSNEAFTWDKHCVEQRADRVASVTVKKNKKQRYKNRAPPAEMVFPRMMKTLSTAVNQVWVQEGRMKAESSIGLPDQMSANTGHGSLWSRRSRRQILILRGWQVFVASLVEARTFLECLPLFHFGGFCHLRFSL